MKRLTQLVLTAAWLVVSTTGLRAEVPGVISYQGRVTLSGTNYTGNGWFKFAIVNAAGNTTAWSNDGSSTGGGQPANAVQLAVSQGVFAVNLGDTNVSGFTQPIPASTFTNNPLYLAAWFSSDGTNYTALTPNLRFTANGYALNAANAEAVSSGAINGTNLAANITITTTGTITAGAFSGGGAGLTGLSAASLTGSISDARLSTNVALLDGSATFAGVVSAGSFSGNGAGLTGLGFTNVSQPGFLSWDLALMSTLNDGGFQFVTAADVNGDGKLDLISSDVNAGELFIYMNDGDGGFTLSSSVAIGGPVNIVAADVNGDGRIDLITPNFSGGSVSVLTNDGHGGFTLSSSPAVGSGPVFVAAADVNGDGSIDLISANLFDQSLTVLTNDGHGAFATATTVAGVRDVSSVIAADMNGDGKPDLIATCRSSTCAMVFTNDGAGGFILATSIPGSQGLLATTLDVNGDGKLDLVIATGNDLLVYTNTGGGLEFQQDVPLASGPVWVTAADMNGDGRTDLVVSESRVVEVCTNNGAGGFSLAQTLAVGGVYQTMAADFNGDGRMDLAAATETNLLVYLYAPSIRGALSGNGSGLTSLNTANLTGSVPSALLTSVPAGNLTGSVADARLSANVALLDADQSFSGANNFNSAGNNFTGNGSGLTELAAANLTGTIADTLLSTNVPLLDASQTFSGANAFTNDANVFIGDGSGLTGLAAASLTGSIPSAVLTSVPAGSLTGSIADTRLSTNVVLLNSSPAFTGTVSAGGFSGNGAGVTSLAFENVSQPGFLSWGLTQVSALPNADDFVVVADVNRDGKLDLVSIDYFANALSIYTNDGAGGFTLSSSPAAGHPLALTAADVNGDGWIDLISADFDDNRLSVLTNDGHGGFTLSSSPAVGSGPLYVTAADVNGDGRIDLISASLNDSNLTVLTNDGHGAFAVSALVAGGGNASFITTADMNGDGKPDLIAAFRDSQSVNVYTNDGAGGFTFAASISAFPVYSLTALDVNGDGKLDLVIPDENGSDGLVYTNTGGGGLAFQQSIPLASPSVWVTAADMNGDGRMDLVFTENKSVQVCTNNGDGGFSVSQTLTNQQVYQVVAADFNADGRMDLVGANDTDLLVWLYGPAIRGIISGNGSGLTSLNAAGLSGSVPAAALTSVPAASLTGSIAEALLPTNVAFLDTNQIFTGANAFVNSANRFTGDGSGLLGLNATNLTGTIADLLLSTNVALLNASQTFSGPNTFTGPLIASGTNQFVESLQGASASGTGLELQNTSAGGHDWSFVSSGSGNGEGAGKLEFRDAANIRMLIDTNGHVGIGSAPPTKALLQVQGNASTVPGQLFGYLDASGNTGESPNSQTNTAQPYSIWVSDRIAASEFNAISDARVKNIKGRSDSTADLRTLMGIEITDYTFKDTVAKGNRPQKKVIAQQVEQVYPQAVSTTRDVVPDIFVGAEANGGWVRDNSGHLKTGERVRIISGEKTETYEVIEASEAGFRVNLPADGKVFVYGREVSDFHTVDYDAIAMLNVSATQAQQREIERLQAENASLRERLQKIEERLAGPSRETAAR